MMMICIRTTLTSLISRACFTDGASGVDALVCQGFGKPQIYEKIHSQAFPVTFCNVSGLQSSVLEDQGPLV